MKNKSKPIDEGCVLVVDDEEPIRESMRDLLKGCGFTVLLAESYEKAVQVLDRNENIETILCDWKMPGKSGLEVLRYVNQKKMDIPLVFLTGYGSIKNCQDALREGAFDYILKPIDDKDRVILPLKHAIEKRRLERENREMRKQIMRVAEEIENVVVELIENSGDKEMLLGRISKICSSGAEDG